MEVFARNIIKQEFYDEFENANLYYNYAQTGTITPTISGGMYSCIDMTVSSPSTNAYSYLTSNLVTNRLDWKNGIMKAIFMGIYGLPNNFYPEFGYYIDESTHLLVSVNPTTYYFCLKQNGTILANTDLLYEANKTYIAMLSCNETGDKASLIIGDYPTREDFRNVKMRIVETTITAPTQKYIPVFGCRGMNDGRFRWDLWGFSVERLPIETA